MVCLAFKAGAAPGDEVRYAALGIRNLAASLSRATGGLVTLTIYATSEGAFRSAKYRPSTPAEVNMPVYDLYGAASDDMNKAKLALEEALKIKFIARDSTYNCGEYFLSGQKGEENFVLKRNLDPFDLAPLEMDFPQYPMLLYVNHTSRSEELFDRIQAGVKELTLLSHKEL